MGFNPHGYCPTCGSMKHDQDCVFCGEQRELQIINAAATLATRLAAVERERDALQADLSKMEVIHDNMKRICQRRRERYQQAERERDALREWAEQFIADTKALPYQHEDPSKGCCTYNWHAPIMRKLTALLGKENTDGNATR